MPFCPKCGTQVPENAVFCSSCGNSLGQQAAPPKSEFDKVISDQYAQEHWLKRLFAYIIDSIIFGIAFFILELIFTFALFPSPISIFQSGFLPFFAGFGLIGLASGILFVLYFTISETLYSATIGKRFLHLRVVMTDGSRVNFEKSLIRNLSKIFVLLLLLDVLVGLFSNSRRGQKYSDYYAGTNVIRDGL